MKKISLSKFIKKYRPTIPYPPYNTDVYKGLMWDFEQHREYILNKKMMYVWSVVKDPDKGMIAIPALDITHAIGFFISTVPWKDNNREYVKL